MTSSPEVNKRTSDTTPGNPAHRWLVLTVLLVGLFMTLLDVAIVNIAIPTIGRTLHGSGADLQLVVSGYGLTYAMLLITSARLGDLHGRRTLFLIGIIGFTLASLACGLAPSTTWLIVARFIQGIAAAAMVPQIMSVIQAQFQGAARAKAIGAYMAVIAFGSVAGQLLGGLLTSANLFGLQWRPIFLINVPVGLAVTVLLLRLVPSDKPARTRRLDLVGLVTSATAVFLIVLPLILGHQEGWPAWTLACIAAGLVLAAVFAWLELQIARRGGSPVLNLRVFKAPGLAAGLGTIALTMTAYGGYMFSLSVYLQDGLGFSALRTGLTFAPSAAAFGLCSFYWRKMPARTHLWLAPVGFALAGLMYLSIALYLGSSNNPGGAMLQIRLITLAGALGLGFSSLMVYTLSKVTLPDIADASGLLSTTLQLAQVIGVATLGSIFLALAGGTGQNAGRHGISTTIGLAVPFLACGVVTATILARAMRRPREAAAPQSAASS